MTLVQLDDNIVPVYLLAGGEMHHEQANTPLTVVHQPRSFGLR